MLRGFRDLEAHQLAFKLAMEVFIDGVGSQFECRGTACRTLLVRSCTTQGKGTASRTPTYEPTYVAAYSLSKSFREEERYSSTSQIRRSSRSIAANITEGFRNRQYPNMFVSKLADSDAEAAETQWRDTKVRRSQRAYRTRQQIPQRFVLTSYNSHVTLSDSLLLAPMPPLRKAEDSAACLAVLGRGRFWRMCDDWGHRARVQTTGQGFAFKREQNRSLPNGAAREEHS